MLEVRLPIEMDWRGQASEHVAAVMQRFGGRRQSVYAYEDAGDCRSPAVRVGVV